VTIADGGGRSCFLASRGWGRSGRGPARWGAALGGEYADKNVTRTVDGEGGRLALTFLEKEREGSVYFSTDQGEGGCCRSDAV